MLVLLIVSCDYVLSFMHICIHDLAFGQCIQFTAGIIQKTYLHVTCFPTLEETISIPREELKDGNVTLIKCPTCFFFTSTKHVKF